jgi:putative spermidine/putrescine transport system permease protein
MNAPRSARVDSASDAKSQGDIHLASAFALRAGAYRSRLATRSLAPALRGFFRVVAFATLIFLVAPVLIVFPVSLTRNTWLSLPTTGISFRHYVTVTHSAEWLDPLAQSLVIATLVMILATALGTAAAIGAWRLSHPAARLVRTLVLMPLIIPPVVSALAMYRVWVDLGIFDTVFGTVLAHTIIATPFVFMTVSAALANVDPRIEQASRSLGASVLRTTLEVVVPCIRPSVLVGALFAFIASWDEVVITLFVTARNVFTLPRKIFQDLRDTIDPAVAAVSSMMIAVTLAVALAFLWHQLRRGRSVAT